MRRSGSSGVPVRTFTAAPPPATVSCRHLGLPDRGSTPPRAAVTAAPSLGMIPPSRLPLRSSSAAASTAIEPTTAPSRISPSTSVRKSSSSAPIPIAIAAAASSAFTFSGPRSGETTGIAALLERGEDGRQRRGAAPRRPARAPPPARLRARSRPRTARTARSPIAAHSARVDGGERARARSRVPRARDAAAADELDRDPGPLHLARDLRAGAVDDAEARARAPARRPLGRAVGDRAADLDHQPAHVR